MKASVARSALLLVAATIVSIGAAASGPVRAVGAADQAYITERVTFQSGPLRMRALLGRPSGTGPFPAYISNHGSMTVQEAARGPWTFIVPESPADTLVKHGYVVLVLARRGYRGSEGTTTTYSTGFVSRGYGKKASDVMRGAQAEAEDVIAALDYLQSLPFVDRERVAVGGVSLGGLVSVIAAARDPRFKALISMAGGYRQTEREGGADEAWPLVEATWKKAAVTITAPTLILWSRNDMQVDLDVGRALERALKKAGKEVELKVYPGFEDNGHRLFSSPKGFPVFVPDVLRFLDAHLKR
jgi:dienelactone hydrolase